MTALRLARMRRLCGLSGPVADNRGSAGRANSALMATLQKSGTRSTMWRTPSKQRRARVSQNSA